MKSFTSTTKSLILALVLTIGVATLQAAGTWSGPTASAPNGNVDTPLNVGENIQFKLGGLVLNTTTNNSGQFGTGLQVYGKTVLKALTGGDPLQVYSSTTPGQVLVAKDYDGNIGWGTGIAQAVCPNGQFVRGYGPEGMICGDPTGGGSNVNSCSMATPRPNRYISEQTYLSSGATGSCIVYSPTTSGVNQGKSWAGEMRVIHPGGSYGDVAYCQAGSISSWASWGPSAGLPYANFDYQICQ